MRRLARAILAVAMAGSLALTLLAAARIAAAPELRPLRDRTAAEIVAVTDRMMAAEATPERLGALITARLEEEPRNWVALTALHEVVLARGLAVDPAVLAAYDAAWEEDSGWLAVAGDCGACILDITACSLSTGLMCKAPVLFTPIEDLRGIGQAVYDYVAGEDVDEIDLGLSVVGLTATGLIVVSGGTSATIKSGAVLAKLARGMRLLSPRLTAFVADTLRVGIDWTALRQVGGLSDLPKVIRVDDLAPVADLALDLGRVYDRIGTAGTLHMVRYVDDVDQARQLARATEALGPRVVARAEVLGPTRLFRATLRTGELAWQALAGLAGLFWSLAAVFGGLVQGRGLRLLRRLV